jgi:fluoride exporter
MSPELAATIWIGVGGALGGVTRYAIDNLLTRIAGNKFPWGTLVVNVVGCFLIGYLGEPALTSMSFSALPGARFLIAIGVFGGFTTFSFFSMQTFELLQNGRIVRALLYAAGSIFLCLSATALGLYAAGFGAPTPA